MLTTVVVPFCRSAAVGASSNISTIDIEAPFSSLTQVSRSKLLPVFLGHLDFFFNCRIFIITALLAQFFFSNDWLLLLNYFRIKYGFYRLVQH